MAVPFQRPRILMKGFPGEKGESGKTRGNNKKERRKKS
jgi:hypothetical protein